MVDFSSSIGAGAAFERPAVIASKNAANESALEANRGVDSAKVGTIWTGVIAMLIYHVVVSA